MPKNGDRRSTLRGDEFLTGATAEPRNCFRNKPSGACWLSPSHQERKLPNLSLLFWLWTREGRRGDGPLYRSVSTSGVSYPRPAAGRGRGLPGTPACAARAGAAAPKGLGLEFDLTARGMGVRSQRYSMLVDDGVVKAFNL